MTLAEYFRARDLPVVWCACIGWMDPTPLSEHESTPEHKEAGILE